MTYDRDHSPTIKHAAEELLAYFQALGTEDVPGGVARAEPYLRALDAAVQANLTDGEAYDRGLDDGSDAAFDCVVASIAEMRAAGDDE